MKKYFWNTYTQEYTKEIDICYSSSCNYCKGNHNNCRDNINTFENLVMNTNVQLLLEFFEKYKKYITKKQKEILIEKLTKIDIRITEIEIYPSCVVDMVAENHYRLLVYLPVYKVDVNYCNEFNKIGWTV